MASVTIEKLKYGQAIQRAIRRRGLTQQALADLLGAEKGMVNRWIRGLNEPRIKYRRKIKELLGVGSIELKTSPAIPLEGRKLIQRLTTGLIRALAQRGLELDEEAIGEAVEHCWSLAHLHENPGAAAPAVIEEVADSIALGALEATMLAKKQKHQQSAA